MSPKEELAKGIVNLVNEFYEKTGVALKDLNVQWHEVTERGDVAKKYVILGVDMEMK